MWSYTGNPRTSRMDEVRFMIGDTNSNQDEQLLQNEEILYALSLYPISTDTTDKIDHTRQPLHAALVCAEAILAYFERQADETLPPVTFKYSERAKTYRKRVDDLRKLAIARGGAIPYVGGVSVADKIMQRFDSDRTESDFYRKEMDNHSDLLGD